jgi:hypothetical protein
MISKKSDGECGFDASCLGLGSLVGTCYLHLQGQEYTKKSTSKEAISDPEDGGSTFLEKGRGSTELHGVTSKKRVRGRCENIHHKIKNGRPYKRWKDQF